jgi:DNA (cytosine-5)-methyltransferase 1
VDSTKELKHLSLCAGYGGIDIGLKKALGDVRTVTYVEIETFPICNLVAKMEKGFIEPAPIWSNLKTLDWEIFRGKVDILSGGFPCQPFSSAGKRKADSDPRHLFPHIIRGVKVSQPSVIFLENVEGILSAELKSDDWSDPKGTSVLLHVLRELERVGYEATAGIFSAREVGAPHKRKRVFILAIKRGTEREGLEWVNGLLDRNRDTSGSVYPSSRGRDQYSWEPPRVTLGDSQYSRPSRPEERRGIEKTSKSRGEEKTLPSRQSTGAGEPSRNRDISGSPEGDSREGSEHPFIWDANSNNAGNTPQRDASDNDGSKESERGGGVTLSEPPRSCEHGQGRCNEVEPEVGRDLDGASDRVGAAKLYESFDNRTDELRMLGNGVVPDTARRAFVDLWRELVNSSSFTEG